MMRVRWHGHTEEPQVRDVPVVMIQNENGAVTFKDRNGGVLLMVPVARLIEAETVNG